MILRWLGGLGVALALPFAILFLAMHGLVAVGHVKEHYYRTAYRWRLTSGGHVYAPATGNLATY